MKIKKLFVAVIGVFLLSSCASGYRMINPRALNYVSGSSDSGVSLEYKYDLLEKKYAKNETKKGVKLVAIKITNSTGQDLIFGKDIRLSYENDNEIHILENEHIFKSVKQSAASYLFYLLLTPLNLYTTNSSGNTSSTPIGLIAGPSLTGANMIAAGSANKKFKEELLTYDLNGSLIKKGEITYGLIGIKTDNYDAIKVKLVTSP